MITTIVFLVFAALFTFLGVLKGKKYTWVFSAARIVGAVISAVLTMLLSVLIARLLGGLAAGILGDAFTGDMAGLLEELPSLRFALEALVAMFISPILFWPIFPIVYNLLNILLKWICRMLVKVLPHKISGVPEPSTEEGEQPKKRRRNAPLRAVGANPVGMILGGVCGLLLFCIALVPLVGLTGTVHDVAVTAVAASGQEDELPPVVTKALDESVNNVGAVVVRTVGGQALYNGLTTYWAGEDTVHLNHELSFVGSLGGALATYADADIPRAEAAEAIRNLEPALAEATLLPKVGAELVSTASGHWTEGEAFHGIQLPSPAGYESLIQTIVTTQNGATVQTFCEDMGTVIRMVASLVEKDAMSQIKGDAMALIGNEDLTEDLLYELLENPRLYVTIGTALDLGVEKIGDSLEMHSSRAALYDELCAELAAVARLKNAEDAEACSRVAADYRKVMESYGIEVAENNVYDRAALASATDTDMATWFANEGVVNAETMMQKTEIVTEEEIAIEPKNVQNKAEEAKLLSAALATMEKIAGKSEIDIADFIADFGPALDALSGTETVGREKSGKIFKAALQSKKVAEKIGFSMIEASDAADTINVNAQRSSYTVQMLSLSQTVRVIRSAGTEEGEAAVEALIKDLTPESASTLQTLSTPSVMINHGVPEKNAEPVSGMMSDMFGNLSDAKETGNMSDEQLQKETAAVNKVMTMGMNAGDSNGKAFGEGSVTGTSANQFVADIMDSEVVSQTVVEQVYGEGSEPMNDPLLTERSMTAAEEAELVSALNNQWTNATEEQKNDENYQKKLVSIAALMNIEVTVGGGGVTKVA